MHLLGVFKWVLVRISGRPVAWCWLVCSLVAWPAVVSLSPVSLTRQSHEISRLSYEVAFLAAIGGATLALAALDENDWLFHRATAARRLACQGSGLVAGALIGVAVGLLAPGIWGGAGGVLWGPVLVALAASVLHTAGVGLVILAIPIGRSKRALALPLLAWLLPSLVLPRGPVSASIASLLRAARPLEAFEDPTPAGLGAVLAPIVALWLCALLLARRSIPDPSSR